MNDITQFIEDYRKAQDAKTAMEEKMVKIISEINHLQQEVQRIVKNGKVEDETKI